MKENIAKYIWDEDKKYAKCELTVNKKVYIGEAFCDPKDMDMGNEMTGCEIAFRRAVIAALVAEREELKIALAPLKQVYYAMNRSKYFNEKSYENVMLQRQTRMIEDDLATVKEMLAMEKQGLKELIEKKEEFYQKIRANRNKANTK